MSSSFATQAVLAPARPLEDAAGVEAQVRPNGRRRHVAPESDRHGSMDLGHTRSSPTFPQKRGYGVTYLTRSSTSHGRISRCIIDVQTSLCKTLSIVFGRTM